MEKILLNKNVIELSKFYTWMGDDGVARTVVKPQAEISLADAVENTKAVEKLFEGEKFPLLIDTRNVKYISKEARDHFSIKDRDTVLNGFALLIGSPLSRIIGNFFMGLNKPTVPMKLFTSEREAIKWLKQFV